MKNQPDKYKLVLANEELFNMEGEYVADTLPCFQGVKYDDFMKMLEDGGPKYLEPMTAHELTLGEIKDYTFENLTLGEEKFDGHRALIHFTKEGNRAFSRRVSKETKWFSENSDQIPHIRDLPNNLWGTVIDGELLLPIENCTCRQVQSVTGALPPKAIEKQLEVGFAYMQVFDILYYKGINVQKMPLWKRKVYLWNVIKELNTPFLEFCTMYSDKHSYVSLVSLWEEYKADVAIAMNTKPIDSYVEWFKTLLEAGDEGIILKDAHGKYEQKRSKNFIKMKGHQTFDVVIMGYDDPNHSYEGNDDANWPYWYHAESNSYWEGINNQYSIDEQISVPVSKFTYMGWIGAIIFGVWKDGELTQVGKASGLTEEVRQLISENKEDYIGKVIEVEAQLIINMETGSLQHPRFKQFRPDKSSEMCTFDNHIRKLD